MSRASNSMFSRFSMREDVHQTCRAAGIKRGSISRRKCCSIVCKFLDLFRFPETTLLQPLSRRAQALTPVAFRELIARRQASSLFDKMTKK